MLHSRGSAVAPAGWLSRAIVAGFVATSLMTITFIIAYYAAASVANPGGGVFARWLWELTNNPIITLGRGFLAEAVGVHLAVGMFLAVVYAYLAEPVLPGPGWLRGTLFALVPWLISLLVLLPLLGGGLLGLGLGAGPLPILGNLILHLVYGASLGWTYSFATSWRAEVGGVEGRAAVGAERGLALGILAGLSVGGLVGWLLAAALAPVVVPGAAPSTVAEFALAGALLGAAAGAIVGPYTGLSSQ